MSCMASQPCALKRVALAGLAWLAWHASAAEPAAGVPKPEPPVIRIVQPLGMEPGEVVRLNLRGHRLDGVSEVLVQGWKDVRGEIVARGEATPINGLDVARVGDRRLEVKLAVPADAAPGTNAALVLKGTNGASTAFPLLVVRKGLLTGEKEPNDGFRDAPGAPVPLVLRGGFAAKGDVDVFRVTLPAGRRLRAEVMAERLGTTLDATLAVHDARRAVVATVDDAAGRDPWLEFEARDGGDYYVVVGYANDQAAPTHEYLLFLSTP